MEKINLHTHCNFCDGKNTAEEMVLSAIQKGFTLLGFSSHSMLPYTSDWHIPVEKHEDYVKTIHSLKEKYKEVAEQIPVLPEKITFETIKKKITGLESVPIGISKDELEVIRYNFMENTGTIITSTKLQNTTYFINVTDTLSLTITATSEDDTAKVVVIGNDSIKEGANKILIAVTAENGDVRYYRIFVNCVLS